MAWQERAIANSAAVARTKQRSIERSRSIIAATRGTTIEARENHTVQQLAKLAGVSLQTFYRYFPSKDDLLLALLEDEVASGVEEMRQMAEGHARMVDRLRSIVTAPLLISLRPGRSEFGTRQHHRLADRFPEEVEGIVQMYIDVVAEMLQATIDAGEVEPLDIASTSRNIGLLALSRYHHAAWGMFVDDPRREAEELWGFCAHAIGVAATAPD